VTASIGVAFAGPGEEISDELVVKADIAMYQAKRAGGAGHHIIDLRDAVRVNDRNGLETELREAFDLNELHVAYQPIVRSRDGIVTGVEALLRWTHTDRGPISAASVVALAEETGLIGGIGAWVLEQACVDRVRWLQHHPGSPLDVAVNVSARQLAGGGFAETVKRILVSTKMDPGSLVLEVTENVFLEDSDQAMRVLLELTNLGIRLALDDFGTGYSSLSYLRRLPVHIVKIDQSFIADIGEAPTDGAILAADTNLAHVLGLTVTAEGVETSRQREEVRAIGCESAQGYYFARPMPAASIAAYLASSPPGRVVLPARGSDPLATVA
jgi:EAL domain-containing protein (putative c-di-GMP-specific phosphodiesterase class I)